MISAPRYILASLLLLALACSGETAEVPASAVQDALDRLDERIGLYKAQFPTVPLKEILKTSPRNKLVALMAVDPRQALENIEHIHRKLDRKVFVAIKREIFRTGSVIKQSPTTPSNLRRRRTVLLEFAEIVKRQGLVLTTYYPGGRSKFTMIRGESEATLKDVDERYKVLAESLEREVAEDRVAAGAGGGGAGGGDWGLGDYPESGTAAGSDDPSEFDDHSTSRTGRTMPGQSESWIAVFMTGFLIITFGSMLVVLLPRFVSYGRAFLKSPFSRGMTTVAADEPFRKGMDLFQRGKYEKAQEFFEKAVAAKGDRANTSHFYLALCLAKQGRKARVIQEVSQIDTAALTTEEIYRLGRACEDSSCQDSATTLYKHVTQRDHSYKDVKARLTKLEKGPA